MNIMFIIPRMGGGGAERVTAHIANYLSENDYDVTLTTFISGESFYSLNKEINYIGASCNVSKKSVLRKFSMIKELFKAVKYISKIIDDIKPDVVISMLTTADIITYMVKKYGKYHNFKWISSERAAPSERNIIYQRILNKIYQSTDMFVCQGNVMFDYYSFVQNRCIIANPLFSLKLPEIIEERKPMEIVASGRLDPKKNFSLLIEAFSMVLKEINISVTLKIYGEGPQRNTLQSQINELQLGDKIILEGSVSDLHDRINGAALFVLSSNYEGFPNVLLEAMAMGLPVISTDFQSGIARELIGSENGIIVPVGDVRALKSAIVKILNNKIYRLKMRKNNPYVREQYNIDTIIKKWLKIIEMR